VMQQAKSEIINPQVGIKENGKINFNVLQNSPNPFRERTTINVQLDNPANLSLSIYSLVGQKVLEVSKGSVNSGPCQFFIDGSNLEPGVYFYTVKANNESVTRKMIVK